MPGDAGGTLPETAARARIEIVVAPGISAMQAAAARAGAPLGHDFCAISLSDLLTPWETIEARIRAAAEGDFVIAFYNPVSAAPPHAACRGEGNSARSTARPTRRSCWRSNLGRDGETRDDGHARGARRRTMVDMLTLVLVGASTTRQVAGWRPRLDLHAARL